MEQLAHMYSAHAIRLVAKQSTTITIQSNQH